MKTIVLSFKGLVLSSALWAAWPAFAQNQATLVYYSKSFTGSTNNRSFTIKQRPDLTASGSNGVFRIPMTIQPTNGAAAFKLYPGGYALLIDQVTGAYPFDVPDSTNTYNLFGLINAGIYIYYPGSSNVVGFASVAGANIRITETNGTNTVTFNPTNAVNVVLDAAGKERLFMDESTLDVNDSRGNTIFESTTNGITTLYTDRISVGPAPRFIADTTKTGIYDETGGHSIEIKANGTIGVQGTLTGNGGGLTNLARSNTNADGIVSSNQVAMLNTAQGWSQAASPTPPMGWNSWAALGSGVDGAAVTNAANGLANGLNRFGYEYVVVDDGWQDTNGTGRNVDGTLRANTNKFPLPGGITNVIAHVHAQGLKFGIYLEGGNATSGGFPASRLTNDVLDASTLASWGIDFLRYGGVTDDQTRNFVYWLQKKSSHPIFVELIPGSDDVSGQFPGTFGQLHWDPWNYGIVGSWPGGALRHWNFDGTSTYSDFILYLADIEQWAKWSSPGHYQNGYFYLRNALANYSQRKSVVSIFAMLNIMLMQDTTTVDFSMTNKNVFEVLNDRLGIAGYSQSKSNGSTAQVFIKPLGQKVGGDVAVALMNQSNGVQSITVNLTNIVGLSNVVTVFDCWSNCWVTVATNQYTMAVPAQGCELLRMRPGIYSPLLVPNSYYASDLQWIGTATNHDTGGNETLIRRDVSYDGNPIQINAVTYGKCLSGVGDAIVEFYTGGRAVTFVATVGGDWVNRAFTAPDFQAKVYADNVLVFTTKKIAAFADSADISVDVTGAKKVGVRIVNPDSAGGTSNDRFIIANPLFVTSRAGQEVEYLRTTELSYASGTPASFFKPGSEGPGNSAYTEGFALNGGTGYTVAWTVPNWCQQATIEMPLLVLSANVAWTNTILTLYSSRNTDARVFNSYDAPCLVNNGQTTLVTSVTFANTNALKRIQWVFNAGTNSATARNVGSPWKVTYQ